MYSSINSLRLIVSCCAFIASLSCVYGEESVLNLSSIICIIPYGVFVRTSSPMQSIFSDDIQVVVTTK